MWVLRLRYQSYLEEAARVIQRCYRGYRSRLLRTQNGDVVSYYFWRAQSVLDQLDSLEEDYYIHTECGLDEALRANF